MPKDSSLSSPDPPKDILDGPPCAEARKQVPASAETSHDFVADPLRLRPTEQPAGKGPPPSGEQPPGDAPVPETGPDLRADPASPVSETIDGQALRQWFHHPGFNRRDGLDDYDGDYRQFKLLGDVVTANLRHRIQRQADGREDSGPESTGRTATAHPHRPTDDKGEIRTAGRSAQAPERENEWIPLAGAAVGRDDEPVYGADTGNALLWKSASCGHGNHMRPGCSRCLEACAHGAISFDTDSLKVRAEHCSGCGACASACPSGALHPAVDDTREMLTQVREAAAGGARFIPVFCGFHTGDDVLQGLQDRLQGKILALGSRRPAESGPEVWLAALAMGACTVIVVDAVPTAAKQRQVRLARRILSGLKLDADTRLLLVDGSPGAKAADLPLSPRPLAAAAWEPSGAKRELLWQAIDHLHDLAAEAPFQVLLDPDAPLGEVRLEPSKCTLCLACVGACPTGALRHGSDRPQVCFRERDCIQCGLCRRVCPEKAVTLIPRVCYDRNHTHAVRVLHHVEPICCSVCGAPFATPGMVAAIRQKLASHWMYQDQSAKDLLTMCRDCRIQSLYAARRPWPPGNVSGRKK